MDGKDIAEAKRQLFEYRNEYFKYWDATAEMTKTGTICCHSALLGS
jgi:hypothetical protein